MTNKPLVGAGQILLEGVKVYVAGPMTGCRRSLLQRRT